MSPSIVVPVTAGTTMDTGHWTMDTGR